MSSSLSLSLLVSAPWFLRRGGRSKDDDLVVFEEVFDLAFLKVRRIKTQRCVFGILDGAKVLMRWYVYKCALRTTI